MMYPPPTLLVFITYMYGSISRQEFEQLTRKKEKNEDEDR